MKNRPACILSLLVLTLAVSPGRAQDEPGRDISLYHVHPDVTTKQYHNRTEQEFRVNENLYMIRTVPAKGSPHYLVDTTGTGELEYRRNAAQLDIQAPTWVLHRW